MDYALDNIQGSICQKPTNQPTNQSTNQLNLKRTPENYILLKEKGSIVNISYNTLHLSAYWQVQ